MIAQKTLKFLLLANLLFLTNLSSDVLIITHPKSNISSLTKKEVKQIYSNRKGHWRNGSKILVAVLRKGGLHKNFVDLYLNKSPRQFKLLWKKEVFTGKCVAPHRFTTEEKLVKFVAENEHAIGYIDSITPHSTVKIIDIVD